MSGSNVKDKNPPTHLPVKEHRDKSVNYSKCKYMVTCVESVLGVYHLYIRIRSIRALFIFAELIT